MTVSSGQTDSSDLSTPRRPNVLLVTVDHWPAHLLGCAGHPDVQTPNLDELALAGVRLTNAYSECPVCIPARRTLMTGLEPRTHGSIGGSGPCPPTMPDAPTMADTFSQAGYQTFAVGKLHVQPIRDRIGFHDVILAEEGRVQEGILDDYEIYLGDQGYAGRQFAHGISNNGYRVRPWHLPDETHVTEWSTRQMIRCIQRRDPTRPAFWYLSYAQPHPPLTPLSCYLDYYRGQDIRMPVMGEWAREVNDLAPRLRDEREIWKDLNAHPAAIREARRAFYAQCTHIDNQLACVIGTLREEGLLNNTVVLFTSDHGDMLGDHGLWKKGLYYEPSANVPFILVGCRGDNRLNEGSVDSRLAGWQDVMPTLLDLAGVPAPDGLDGRSVVTGEKRELFFCDYATNWRASRMVHDGRHKLIYHPAGHRFQLFDVVEDPTELHELSESAEHRDIRRHLEAALANRCATYEEPWVAEGKLVGIPEPEDRPPATDGARNLNAQRGGHWPPPSHRPWMDRKP